MKKKATLIDPLGNESFIRYTYLEKIQKFLKMAKIGDINSLNIIPHIKQQDSYNCGVYVIYFFYKMIIKEPLTDPIDIDKYRFFLKKMLLNNSSNMTKKCLFCGRTIKESDTDIFKCRLCKRYIHNNCLLNVNEIKNGIKIEDKILNNMCDLCREN